MRHTSLIAATVLFGCSSDKAVSVYNSEPAATIIAPVEGAQFESDEIITLEGRVEDRETDAEELFVTWATDIEGLLTEEAIADVDGNVAHSTSAISPGEHVVTLRVVDGSGKSGSNSVSIFVINADDPPTISVRHPAPDGTETGEEGVPFDFEAIVGDPQDEAFDLVVTVNRMAEDGSVIERLCVALPETDGVATCAAALDEGLFDLNFTVEDTDGNTTTSDLQYRVISSLDVDNDNDGFTENEGDCDDTDEDTYPGAFELLNGVDDDCNGLVDDTTTAYDDDGDGFSEESGDCDDGDPAVYPYAAEICDGIDNDCNGVVDGPDSIDAMVWYADVDGDGFGDFGSSTTACEEPAGSIADSSDCNDTDPYSYPGALEHCDGSDNDCDGIADEEGADGCTTYYQDADDDGYGSTISVCSCTPTGDFTSTLSSDCYDSSASVSPTHTSFHSSHRGDGSFDYNCDDTEERRWESTSDSCAFFSDFGCSSTDGWNGGAPTCGAGGTWRETCYYSTSGAPWDWGCYWDTEVARTQTCR